MATVSSKSKEHAEELIIEEESGTIERTVEKVSPSQTEARKRSHESSHESPSKYRQSSDGNRTAIALPTTTTAAREHSLSVPFWKQLNGSHASSQCETRQIGCFSLLKRRDNKECFEDKRYLRVYKYPLENLNVNFDLNVGLAEFVSPESSKSIDPMLWWALQRKEEIFKNDRFTFDFLSWRGVLRMIMFSIYEKHSDWSLAVVKFKGAYFIREYVTDHQTKDEANMTGEHRAFCYYGHKFEEYVTQDLPADEATNSSKEFAGVFLSNIGSHRLLYGGEIDCVLKKESSEPELIELKVCAGKSLKDLPFQHNRKFAKWWLQSFLAGIKTMVIGLRDNSGIVSQLSPLDIIDMERETRTWTRQSFFNFFSMFANFLKKHVIDEYSLEHKEVMLFQFLPSSQKITVKSSSDVKYHFLPDWFYEGFT